MAEVPEAALSFTTADVPTEPVTFTIDGETFHCKPWLTGAAFMKYSKMMSQGGLVSVLMVDEFFSEAMEKAEHEHFRKFIEDPDRRVTTNLLADIFLSVFSRYVAGPEEESRPTKPPRRSRSGRGSTKGGSKASASSQASTPDD